MNWKIFTIIIIGLVIVAIAIFLFQEDEFYIPGLNPVTPRTKIDPEDVANVTEANNEFALDFYYYLKNKEEGNIFFSPYSMSSSLAMTYEGARGETAEQMRSVFYFPDDDERRRTEYAKMFGEINREDKDYKLHTANALWAEKNFEFLNDYFNIIDQYYGGKVTNVDFQRNAEKARIIINNWVEEKTNNKIKDLIPKNVLNPATRLVLTNAIYFKGSWVQQFDEDNTRDQDFKIDKNNIVRVSMMERTDKEARFNYAENEDLQILEMPYSGEELSMLIFLPKEDNLDKLENLFNSQNLLKWKEELKEERVKIFIPKFKFETKYLMAEDLREMGMPIALSASADFSGMTGDKDLFISEVIHQAFVEVNEEGTEAAAATAVIMEELSAGPNNEPKILTFRADHPFMFLIEHNLTGNILFMGRVTNPNI
ncbi:MAG: serpin family protein [Patescibacteria group bacterium]|nr:serpin family protein [Patescibacteria group bacterium]